MKIKEIKEMLNSHNDDEEIIITWWDKEFFDVDKTPISNEGWSEVVRRAERLDSIDNISIQDIYEEEKNSNEELLRIKKVKLKKILKIK
jgi:hypothetical protein